MTVSFTAQLTGFIPILRGYARSLSLNHADADDLVQETLLRALSNREKFKEGSNLKAWLFTILRNTRLSRFRKTSLEVEDPDGAHAASVAAPPAQETRIQIEEVERALSRLPDDQREAVMLVGASGFSYAEAASITGASIDAIKKRVSRARAALAGALE